MITLFGKFAPRTARNYWLLDELAEPYEVVPVDYSLGETRTEEYRRLNPSGKIPALRDGELTITESLGINLYLAERYGRGGLWPDDPAGVAAVFQWTLWAATELDPPAMERAIQHLYRAEEKRDGERLAELAERCGVLCGHLDLRLRQASYLAGDRFTVADLNVVAVLEILTRTSFDLSHWPAVREWFASSLARPGHAETREREWVK